MNSQSIPTILNIEALKFEKTPQSKTRRDIGHYWIFDSLFILTDTHTLPHFLPFVPEVIILIQRKV